MTPKNSKEHKMHWRPFTIMTLVVKFGSFWGQMNEMLIIILPCVDKKPGGHLLNAPDLLLKTNNVADLSKLPAKCAGNTVVVNSEGRPGLPENVLPFPRNSVLLVCKDPAAMCTCTQISKGLLSP